jgi:hypothetical protein
MAPGYSFACKDFYCPLFHLQLHAARIAPVAPTFYNLVSD